jgi:hypothetical protein
MLPRRLSSLGQVERLEWLYVLGMNLLGMYHEAMHVYAAAGCTRAHMGLHVPTADVMT